MMLINANECLFNPCFVDFYSRSQSTQADTSSDEAVNIRPEGAQVSNLMEIGVRKIFSEEHDMFRQNVRRFFQEEIVPNHSQWVTV